MIKEIYAYVVEEKEGGFSIPALRTPDGAYPLITTNECIHVAMQDHAEAIAKEMKIPMYRVKWSNPEILETIEVS